MTKTSDSGEEISFFGYGSLMNADSRDHSLGRVVEDARPRVISGFTRAWTAAYELPLWAGIDRSHGLVSPKMWHYLDLVEEETAQTKGVVFSVSARDLEILSHREVGYHLVAIEAGLVTFVYEDHRRRKLSGDPRMSAVSREYLRLLKDLGDDEELSEVLHEAGPYAMTMVPLPLIAEA